MRKLLTFQMVLLLAALLAGLAKARPSQQRTQQESTGSPEKDFRIFEELKQIRLQIEQMKKQLAEALPTAEHARFDVSGGYTMGQKDAPVILVEFADYQCPFCRQFHTTTFQKLRKN